MKVRAGVLVDAAVCAELGRAAAAHLRARGGSDELRRIIEELSEVGHKLDPADPSWVTAREAAKALHCSVRTVARRAERGQIERREVAGRWVYLIETGANGSRSPRRSRTPPTAR